VCCVIYIPLFYKLNPSGVKAAAGDDGGGFQPLSEWHFIFHASFIQLLLRFLTFTRAGGGIWLCSKKTRGEASFVLKNEVMSYYYMSNH